MNLSIGQNVKYVEQKAKVVGIISAFMEPGKFPNGIDDISQEYLQRGFDCTRWEKDSILLETGTGLIRVPICEVKEIIETKKRKK